MNMRVDSENPIALLKAVVRENLGQAWIGPEAIEPFVSDCEARPVTAFEDQAMTIALDPASATRRIAITTGTGVLYLWKGVHVTANGDFDGSMFLMTNGMAIFATQTEISRREDGIMQLGGEKGICLLLPEHVQAQRGNRTYTGESFKSFTFETKAPTGEWGHAPLTINLAEAQVKRITSGNFTITQLPK